MSDEPEAGMAEAGIFFHDFACTHDPCRCDGSPEPHVSESAHD